VLTLRMFKKPPSRTLAFVWRPGSPLGEMLRELGLVLAQTHPPAAEKAC